MFKKQRIFLVPVVALALTVLFAVFAFATTSVTSLKISKPTSKKVYLTTVGGVVLALQATAMPTNATTKTAIFTSSDPTVIQIANDYTATCQAIALKPGTADITATATDGSGVSSNSMTLTVYQPVWTVSANGGAAPPSVVSNGAIVLKLGDDFKNYLGLDVEPMDSSNPLTKTLVTGAKYTFKDTEGVISVDKIDDSSDLSQLSVKAKKAPKDPSKPVTLNITVTADGNGKKSTTKTSISFYVTVPMTKLAFDTKIVPKKMYVGTTYGAITIKSGLRMTPKAVSPAESLFDITASDPTAFAIDNSANGPSTTSSSVKLIPLKSGTYTITVTDRTNSAVTATEDVTVLQPVTGCTVTTQGGVGIAVGSTTTIDFEPQPWDSTNKKTLITHAKYTFKDKEGVLKVDKIDDSTDLTKLTVTAKKAPKDPTKPVTLTITITADGQKKKSTTTASINFMVKVPPTKIKLNGKDSKTTFPKIAFYNKPTTISAITTPLKVSSSDGYVTYTWNSTDNTVATVVPGTTTGTAILTVLKDGSADITCTANWMTDSAQTLASNAYTVTGYVTTAAIKITDTGAPTATSSAISLSGTGSASLSAALLSAGGASGPTPSATDIKWTSSNAAVASVDASGTSVSVTGKKAGSATITAVVKESSKAGIKTPAKATWTVTVTK